jgi:methionyl-tRNA formyltransferase
MKISILCTDKEHPIFPILEEWKHNNSKFHEVVLVDSKNDLPGGEILFLISCNEIIRENIREKYKATLVVHASDLPRGRGWSPHIWQILEGRNNIKVSLLEAEDSIDTGAIWAQREFFLEGHELADEINNKLFKVELELLDFAMKNLTSVRPRAQTELGATYYSKRTPADNQLDPDKTIAEQFNLLRIADGKRYPAFFDWKGQRYLVLIKKISQNGK